MTIDDLKRMIDTYKRNSHEKPYLLIDRKVADGLLMENPEILNNCKIIKHPMCIGGEAYLIDAKEIEFYWDVRQLTTGNKKHLRR